MTLILGEVAFWVGLVVGAFTSLLSITAGCLWCVARFARIFTAAVALEPRRSDASSQGDADLAVIESERPAPSYAASVAELDMSDAYLARQARPGTPGSTRYETREPPGRRFVRCYTCEKIRGFFRRSKTG